MPSASADGWAHNDIDQFILASQAELDIRPVADADEVHTAAPRSLFRSDWAAADARGDEEVSRDDDARRTPRRMRRSSIACSRRRSSANAGAATGSTWRAMRSARARTSTSRSRMPGAIATTSSRRSTRTSRTTSSCASRSPAICCRPRTTSNAPSNSIATGFLASARKREPGESRQFALDLVDEQIDTVCKAVLGVTVGCARCHDHKFDPIPQKDYYALAGIFLSTDTHYGTFAAKTAEQRELIELPTGAGVPSCCRWASGDRTEASKSRPNSTSCSKKRTSWPPPSSRRPIATHPRGQVALRVIRIRSSVCSSRTGAFGSEGKCAPGDGCADQARAPQPDGGRIRWRTAADQASHARERDAPAYERVVNESPVFERGDVNKPGEKVPRGFLALTHQPPPKLPRQSSGRRELAEWMLAAAIRSPRA